MPYRKTKCQGLQQHQGHVAQQATTVAVSKRVRARATRVVSIRPTV